MCSYDRATMNVKRRVSKKIKRKEEGVSEVLGSILVLLITVMLFSTVFYYVGSMPTPQPRIYAQFDASMKIEQGPAGYYLNITVKNVGGESLVDWRTMFIIVIDFTAKQHMLSWIDFSKQPFDRDGKFSQGESFYYNSSWDGFVYSSEAVVKNLNVGITLMDKNTGSIIWSTKLQGGTGMAPVLVGLTTTPSPPILGKVSTFKAIVFNPNNGGDVGTYKVYLDFSDSILKYTVEGSPVKLMDYAGHNAFTTFVNLKYNESLNILRPYPVKISINNGTSNISYTTHIYVSRGTQTQAPDLYIDPTLITMSTLSPTHGDNVQVSVTVENLGGTGAKFQLRVLDKYPGYVSASNPQGEIYIKTNLGSSEYLPTEDTTYTVAAAGQTTISFIWEDVGADYQGNSVVSKVSGAHQLVFQIINVTPVENPNKYPDTAAIGLTVLPSILLVDDDGYAEGAALDTSRYYKYYLDTAGYKYTVDKSSLDIGQLKNDIDSHDLVIWETGYKESPLTSTQASILQDYVANKGGALWLISQEISQSNLKIVLDDNSINVQKNSNIEYFDGIANTPINLTLSNGKLVSDIFFNRDGAQNGNDTIYFSTLGTYHTFIEGNTSSSPNKYPIAVYREFSAYGGKIVYTGFELSRIKHYYSQDFIAYRILKWLANITGRAGNDLAVEDMIITPRDPLYKQPVHISVIVSNNGGSPLSSEVLLEVDGINTLNINTTNPNSTGTIPPDGGFVTVNFTWIPTQPGKHVLTAIVDPYNRIKETNEENNIINTEIVDTNVFVHFSTLVVYNSSKTYSVDEKNAILSTLNTLGYRYKILDTYSSTLPEGYSDGNYFAQYNLVIWADAKIGNRDIKAIMDSMSNNPNTGQLFIGTDLAGDISASSKLTDYLKIDFEGSNVISADTVLYGVNNAESVSNGLSLIIQPTLMYNISADNGQALFTKYALTSSGYSSLEKVASYYSQDIPSSGFGVISKVPVSGAKYGIVPFNVDNIVGLFGLKNSTIAKPYSPQSQSRAWLLFRLFRYFGFESLKPELATFTSDIQIIYGGNNPNLPPIIGRSYMLRTKVYNYGSVGANAIVRFYDDFEWIGSKTVYIPGGKYAQVEIAWTPMFAGAARHIRVIVDPLNEVQETKWNGTAPSGASPVGDELFNFNNEAIKTVRVYYFWDNMENGAGNWIHQATVLDINGESPLDFVNRNDVSTNVIGTWDWQLSGDTDSDGVYQQDGNVFYSNDTKVLNFTKGTYHSAPNSFWMPEAPRINKRKPVDIIFVIDTSGSMSTVVPGANVGDINHDGIANSRLDVAISAAENATKLLGPNDRVAIFDFKVTTYWSYVDTSPQMVLGFTDVGTGYDEIDNALKGIKLTYSSYYRTYVGATPLYDTLSWAIYYMDKESADNINREDATRGIIVLTDGLSNDDTSGISDGKQFYYSPGTGYGEVESGPVNVYEKYKSSGLLKVPYNLLAISVAPDGWDGRLFPIGNSSQGRVSMGLFEDDPVAIQQVFQMFIQLLIQQSTGGLRAVSPTSGSYENSPILGAGVTIKGLGAVVFSDGFRAYAKVGGTGTPDDANTPGFLGKWKQSGFTVTSTSNGVDYYKDQSLGEDDEYWVAQTDQGGAYLTHMIYPGDVLKYHYPGSYTIQGAEIRFWVGRNMYYTKYPDATIDVYANGQLIETINNVLKKADEQYYSVTIPVSIYTLPSYTINITVESTNSYLAIDDVMVVYYIDYTPPGGSSSNSGGTIPADYSSVVDTQVNYTYFITPSVDVSGAKRAILTFWTKYWMTQGTNGGIMYVWGSNDANTWTWDQQNRYYLMPTQSYTGNLKIDSVDKYATTGGPVIDGVANGLEDAKNTKPYWCFNGRSGSGTFDWEFVEVDLTPYLQYFKYIRVVFMLVQFGGVPPGHGWDPAMGWYLDDVKIMITSDGSRDLWQLHNFGGTGPDKAHSGDYAWAYGDPNNNWALPKGVDSSLITKQIDLTTARTVNLYFWIRFNINSAAGVPPATIRVEISDDNGMTWSSITYGVRIAWGASGTGGIAGTSDTGSYGWVNSGTLARINCDLSGWAGRSIFIRFRVVTNATDYPTYASSTDPYGVFLDDVVVYGEGYASTIGVSGNYLWENTKSVSSSVNIIKPHREVDKHVNSEKKKANSPNIPVVKAPPLLIQEHNFHISSDAAPLPVPLLWTSYREIREVPARTLFPYNAPFRV